MSPLVAGLIVLSGFMVARGVAMVYLALRVGRVRALMERYWGDEVDYDRVGPRKRDIVTLLEEPRSRRRSSLAPGRSVWDKWLRVTWRSSTTCSGGTPTSPG
jgi:hypothetical protein